MEKHTYKNNTATRFSLFLFSEKFSSALEATAEKWTKEAHDSVHAYEAALRQINAAPDQVLTPAHMTSLYGNYLRDARESI